MEEQIKENIQDSEEQGIDIMEYVWKLWDARKLLLKAAGIGIIVGVIIALTTPKQYTVEVTLSPESGNSTSSNMSGVASMLGLSSVNLGSGTDALNVLLFPNIVASTPFLLDLFDTQVTLGDGETSMTFVDYLKQQKSSLIDNVKRAPHDAMDVIQSLFKDKEKGNGELNPFQLTEGQDRIIQNLRRAIVADVNSKTGITTVRVTLQDPVVTATIADAVVTKLQEYITKYRVSKAQQDCEYLEKLFKERQQEYYAAQQHYAAYIDANKGVILQSALTERERLQNEMSLAYQIYSQVATQLQVARAKVQEAKPVFAVVEPATVPLLPSSTSRKVILIAIVFLAVAGTAAWVLFGPEYLGKLKELLKRKEE